MMRFVTPVLALLFFLAMLGAWAFVYFDIQSTALAVGLAREEVVAVTSRDAYAKAAAQFVAETATEQAVVIAFITPADGTAAAIELIEDAGRSAKVVASVTAAEEKSLDVQRHELLDITVSARGTFAAVTRFGTMLELMPRGAYLKSARLEWADKSWQGTYTVSFIKRKPL